MIESYYRFVFTSAYYPFSLTKQTSLKLLPKIIYGQVYVVFTINNIVFMVLHTLSEEMNFSKCTIGDHKNNLINLYGVIQSTTWNRH